MNDTLDSLLNQARRGDRSAEVLLFERLRVRFCLFARHRIGTADDVEDVVQDALKTVFEKYRSIEFETSFTGWAYQVLINKLLTHSRAGRVRRERFQPESDLTPPAIDPEPVDLTTRLLRCLRKLHTVNPRHARVLNLSYQGFEVDDICRRLDLTRTNLYTILSRARTMLQHCLDQGELK